MVLMSEKAYKVFKREEFKRTGPLTQEVVDKCLPLEWLMEQHQAEKLPVTAHVLPETGIAMRVATLEGNSIITVLEEQG